MPLSSPGLGSGLDVNSIVSQLVALERAPLQKLQVTAQRLQTQLSAIGQLESLVTAFKDALAPLNKTDSYKLKTATTSDAALTITATSGAPVGSYAVSVSSLSAGQTLASAVGQFASSTSVVGTGSLTIRLGAWTGDPPTAFAPKSGSGDVVVPIGAGSNTLAGVRDAINAANAGVTASIITDASGARLSVRSAANGLENGFRITVADDDGIHTDAAGLSRLAYDPPSAVNQMTRAQSAANTVATINGISVSSASDTLADVVEGLTIKINKLPAAAATVTVADDTASVSKNVATFVGAYNSLTRFLSDATRYDPVTKQGALFQGDTTVVSLQTQLRSLLAQQGGASYFHSTLSSLGVQLQTDGTLKVNQAKLDEALKSLPEVSKALANVDLAEPAKNGFAKRFSTWAESLLESTGALPSRKKSLEARLTGNGKEQNTASDRIALVEKRLRAQYSSLDLVSSKYSALNSFVNQFTQQLQTFNVASSK